MSLPTALRDLLSRYQTRTTTRDLALGLVLITTAVLVTAGGLNYAVGVTEAERNLNHQADALADELASGLSAPLWAEDLPSLGRIAGAYRNLENVAGLVIVDQSGTVLYRSVPEENSPLLRTRTIYSGQHLVGQLELWLSRRSLGVIRENVLATTSSAILLVALGVLVATDRLLQRHLVWPLQQLTRGIDHIAAGHYETALAPVPQADITRIIDKINAMARQIADRDAALLEREEEFHQVITSISDYIYFAEVSEAGPFAPRFLSSQLDRLTGYPPEAFAADHQFWLEQVVAPEDRPAVLAHARRLMSGESSELEYRLRARGGQVLWVRDSARVEATGASQFIYGVISDVTARKRAEQVQAATYRISEAALTAPTLDELYSSLHAIIGELMPARNFYIALYDAPADLVHFAYHADEQDTAWEPMRPQKSLTGYVLQTGKSLLATAEVFEQMVQAGLVELVGGASQDWLGVPLKTQQATLGVMVVQTYQGAPRLGETERDILTFVSAQVAMAIERKRAEEALRLDEARLDALAHLNDLTEAAEKAITDFALAEAVRLTESVIGYVGFVNEAQNTIAMYSWSEQASPAHAASPAPLVFPVTPEGPLGDAIRLGKPVVSNEPPANGPGQPHTPPGHMPLQRDIVVPIFEGDRIVVVAGVANKPGPYDEADVRQLTLLMQGMWRILQRGRAMTEIRQLNADLERRVEERTAQLTAVNQELEAFAYSVSHDLRAPLRAINGFSQTILEDYGSQVEPDAQRLLQRIRAATVRMAQLIDDLLQLSRVTRSEIQMKDVDLCQLVRERVAALRAADPAREVEAVVPPQRVVRADANLMRIALDNLLDNAWKFTRQRQAARIEFGFREEARRTTFFVCDNGAGFDNAYVGKLFGAFQRLHAADEFEGTGIGLAIVQRIIRRHGGEIWAVGAVEQGATFFFTLGG